MEKNSFYEDAANEVILEAYRRKVTKNAKKTNVSPKVDVTQIEAGKPFIFTAEVFLGFKFLTLGKYNKGREGRKDLILYSDRWQASL